MFESSGRVLHRYRSQRGHRAQQLFLSKGHSSPSRYRVLIGPLLIQATKCIVRAVANVQAAVAKGSSMT